MRWRAVVGGGEERCEQNFSLSDFNEILNSFRVFYSLKNFVYALSATETWRKLFIPDIIGGSSGVGFTMASNNV